MSIEGCFPNKPELLTYLNQHPRTKTDYIPFQKINDVVAEYFSFKTFDERRIDAEVILLFADKGTELNWGVSSMRILENTTVALKDWGSGRKITVIETQKKRERKTVEP